MAGAAFGTKLILGTFEVADLTSIGGVEITADTIDVTTHASTNGYREFLSGLKDGGEVSISGFFKPTDTNGQKALYTALNAGTLGSFGVSFPTAISASWAFSGIVTSFATGAELEDAVTFEGAIKVSGKPILN